VGFWEGMILCVRGSVHAPRKVFQGARQMLQLAVCMRFCGQEELAMLLCFEGIQLLQLLHKLCLATHASAG